MGHIPEVPALLVYVGWLGQDRKTFALNECSHFDAIRTSVDHLTDCRKPPRTPPQCYSLARYGAWGGQMRRREFSVCLAVRWRGCSLRAVRQTGEVSRMGDRCATP